MTGSWKDIAVELAWRVLPSGASEVVPSWPLDRDWLETISVHWPSRYVWPTAHKWLEPLRHGFERFVNVVPSSLPQPFPHIILIRLVRGGRSWRVAIDYGDHSAINEPCADQCDVYFKMQYRTAGYQRERVIPGGFGPASEMVYRYLPRVRALADEGSPQFEVYGRFRLEFATELRREALRLLSESRAFTYAGGSEVVRYSRFLREVAQAKVCINLPGNGDLCFRLIDYFAVGACVIGPTLRTRLPVPLIDREHIVYTKDDLSDLVPLCRQYLEDDAARERIRENSRALFDRFLCRDQVAAYYLHECHRWAT